VKKVLILTLALVIISSHTSLLLAASKKIKKQSAGVVKLSPMEQGAVKAVENCDAPALKLILSKGVSPNLVIDSNGNNLISLSPIFQLRLNFERCADTFNLLVKSGADLNYKNSNGNSVAIAAATMAQFPKDALELMTQNGAKFTDTKNCPKNYSFGCVAGRTPLMALAGDMVVNQSIVPGTPSFWNETIEHFQYVVSKSDVNARDEKGQTALHIATNNGYINIIKALMNAGASPNIKDNKGMTSVDIAIASGNSSLMGLF
jgi:ankyrin repeat protein